MVNTYIDIKCPSCGNDERLPFTSGDNVACQKCGKVYIKKNGVWCFANNDAYLETFSFEWEKHATMYDSDEEVQATERSLRLLHITPELVRGKRVLDVGCGTGRYSRILSDWGADVVSVDLSNSIWVAKKNSGDRDSILFLHADLLNLPLPEKYFDVILSWGVLHHTPNTEIAFKKVATHLKPGGRYSIYVYGKSKGSRRRMISFYRNVTPHMPMRLLYGLCCLAGPLHYIYKIPVIGAIGRVLFPVSRQRTAAIRIQETFDEYSPLYAFRHTFPEVHQWFMDLGMVDNAIYNPPIMATGVLPI